MTNPLNYQAARELWKREFPEACTEAYTSRGLVDPHCHHHDDDIACWIVDAALGITEDTE